MTTTVLREVLAEAYAAQAAYVSLHTGDPGSTGDNELAVSRVALTWTVAGGVATSDPVSFTIPADTDLTDVGFWSASTGGDFLDSAHNVVSFPTGGSYSFSLTYTPN